MRDAACILQACTSRAVVATRCPTRLYRRADGSLTMLTREPQIESEAGDLWLEPFFFLIFFLLILFFNLAYKHTTVQRLVCLRQCCVVQPIGVGLV